MRIVVVGVYEDILVHRVEGQPADLGVGSDLAASYALGQIHHQRYLVHAAGIEPGVGIEVPLVPRGGVAITDADTIRRHIFLGKKILHHFGNGGAVKNTFTLRRLRRGRKLGGGYLRGGCFCGGRFRCLCRKSGR